MENKLAIEKINAELPVLQRQMGVHGEVTGRARSVIQVHKHQVSIWVDKGLDYGIREGAPAPEWRERLSGGGGIRWFWWLVAALILFALYHKP